MPSSSDDLQGEQPGPSFVPDPSRDAVLYKISVGMLTARMGGVLTEQEDLSRAQRVLDVGCGTGGWLIGAMRTYPDLQLLVGVDVDDQLVQHAREQVELHGLDKDRVQFATMDVLRGLEVPVALFDRINQRFATSWLRRWEWPGLLQEYQRIGCPGGVVRIIEPEMAPSSCSSRALAALFDLLLAAFHQAGHLFAPTRDGLTSHLRGLLQQHGFQQVRTRSYLIDIDYSSGSEEAQQDCENLRYLFRTILPFLRKWTRVPDDYEELYQEALSDIAKPGFRSTSHLVTAWGAITPTSTK